MYSPDGRRYLIYPTGSSIGSPAAYIYKAVSLRVEGLVIEHMQVPVL